MNKFSQIVSIVLVLSVAANVWQYKSKPIEEKVVTKVDTVYVKPDTVEVVKYATIEKILRDTIIQTKVDTIYKINYANIELEMGDVIASTEECFNEGCIDVRYYERQQQFNLKWSPYPMQRHIVTSDRYIVKPIGLFEHKYIWGGLGLTLGYLIAK